MKKFYLLLTTLLTFFAFFAKSQPGAIDQTFNPQDIGYGSGDGVSGYVFATAIQSDGKILIGGDITKYNNITVGNLVRLNPDGSPDIIFNNTVSTNHLTLFMT